MQEGFLRQVEQQLQPDLCLTAAYGCILPQRFLNVPPLGTLNIHPSLLPKSVLPAALALVLSSVRSARSAAALSGLSRLACQVCMADIARCKAAGRHSGEAACKVHQKELFAMQDTISSRVLFTCRYRGAAPVQRALQDGVTETGVSVAYSVLKCDAGPVLAQTRVGVEPDETAPALTHRLFRVGTKMLLEHMPQVGSDCRV